MTNDPVAVWTKEEDGSILLTVSCGHCVRLMPDLVAITPADALLVEQEKALRRAMSTIAREASSYADGRLKLTNDALATLRD